MDDDNYINEGIGIEFNEPAITIKNKKKIKLNLDLNFEKIGLQGRKMVRCKVCYLYPQTVLINYKQKNHIPPICTELGTLPRGSILESHLQSDIHKECIKADCISKLSDSDTDICAPINKLISNQNKKVAQRIGEFMCTIFNDSKRGTLSAWSWPSREVVDLKRKKLDVSIEFKALEVHEGDLQYVTPTNYREFSSCIVQADIINLKNKLKTCLAISLRCDGSVDRTQIDNIHVLAKVITENGEDELIFIGFEEPKSRGALGYFDAVQTAINQLIDWKETMNLVSSFVTDGASVNTGQKKGLWTLIENERKAYEIKVPIMKIWCAVHRSALAWENLTKQVSEVSKIIETCSSISTYFHQSGVRTKELKIMAVKENIKYVQLPKYFDVRWTEFTYSLLVGILKNWRVLVKYFIFNRENNIKDSKAVGFYKILTDINKLKLLCFLADLGYLYTRFQKQIQSDDLLIFDIEARKDGLKKNIEQLINSPLMGGWEYILTQEIVTEYEPSTDNTRISLKEIELHDKISLARTKSSRNLYVSEDRTFSSVRNDSIEHIMSYLDLRLDVSEWNDLKPLACLSESITDEELKICHDKICPDFELLDFVTSYKEACCIPQLRNKRISKEVLKTLLNNYEGWKPLVISVVCFVSLKLF